MADVAWWTLHAIQDLLLLTAVVVAMRGAVRLGGHTPYGSFLFVLSLSFWFLLIGEWLYLARISTGTWNGPGTEADAVSLAGWLLLDVAFLLVVSRFPQRGRPGSPMVMLRLLAKAIVPIVVLLAFFWLVLSPPGRDPDAWLRALYLTADGLGLGLVLAGARPLLRMRRTALGALYVWLAIAVALKILGDLYWAYLAARGETSIFATAFYPLAGLVSVSAILWHDRALAREPHVKMRGEPWMTHGQLVLRDLALQVHGLAGGDAASEVLEAARASLSSRGVATTRSGWIIESVAEPAAWDNALAAARDRAVEILGKAAQDPLQRVATAYGPAYAFLART